MPLNKCAADVRRLEGKVAIVTGAGGGIGRHHALLFAREGAKVVVNDVGARTGAEPESVVDEIRSMGGTAIAIRLSATWDGAEQILAETVDSFGTIDILVNNAGVAPFNDLWRFTKKAWDQTLDVGLSGYFAMIRAAAPHMCRQGSGAIVNTSSASGFGHPTLVAHATAKEGVIGLTRTVAKELGRFGVRCNAIRPFAEGTSTAEYQAGVAPWARLLSLTMGPEPGVERSEAPKPEVERPEGSESESFEPRKISPFVVWLCTHAAANVNGRTFHVRGDHITLLSEPAPEATVQQVDGWNLDDLDALASAALTAGLTNPYALDRFPEMKVFPS